MISWDLQILNGNRVLMVVSYRLTRLPTLLVRTAKQRRGAASFHSTKYFRSSAKRKSCLGAAPCSWFLVSAYGVTYSNNLLPYVPLSRVTRVRLTNNTMPKKLIIIAVHSRSSSWCYVARKMGINVRGNVPLTPRIPPTLGTSLETIRYERAGTCYSLTSNSYPS